MNYETKLTDIKKYYGEQMGASCDIDDYFSSLLSKTVPILFVLPRFRRHVEVLWRDAGLSIAPLRWYAHALLWPQEIEFGKELPGFSQGMIYPMNASSLIPPLALTVSEGMTVCDCASAPGGKTLVLWEQMKEKGFLLANDVSYDRLHRQKSLFRKVGISEVQFSCGPAGIIAKTFTNFFDAILVDAPCSSEKHVFSDQNKTKSWNAQKSTDLHKRQVSIIQSLLPVLFCRLKMSG